MDEQDISLTPSELIDLLKASIPAKRNVLITGAPGIGKTDIVKEGSRMAGADLQITHPVVSDPTDYKGMPCVVDGKAMFLPFGDLERLIDADRLTVCFADDIGQAPASVQAALMQLLLAREINGKKISDEVCFIAATNRRQDKAGVTGLLEPVKSRFHTIVGLQVDVDDWSKWAIKNNMPHDLIAFVRFKPDMLNNFTPSKDLVNCPCPRTVTAVGGWLNLGVDNFKVLAGAAGSGFAAEFLAFRDLVRTMPNPDQVLMNPDKAIVPDNPAVLYALSTALAYRATENNVDNMHHYLGRVPREFCALTWKAATDRDPDLQYTNAFTQYAVDNNDLLK